MTGCLRLSCVSLGDHRTCTPLLSLHAKHFRGKMLGVVYNVAMLGLLLICYSTTTTTSDTCYIVRHIPPVSAFTVPAVALRRYLDGVHFTHIKLRQSLIRILHQKPRRKHAYYTQGLRVCLPSSSRGSLAAVPAIWTPQECTGMVPKGRFTFI